MSSFSSIRLYSVSLAITLTLGIAIVNASEQPDVPVVEPLTIAGKVLTPAGLPAVGATVRVRQYYAKVDASTTTDDTGAFQLPVGVKKELAQSLKISAVSQDGLLIGYLRFRPQEKPENFEQLVLKLEPGKSGKVQVVDQEGKPIQNANVVVQLNFPFSIGEIKTDVDGIGVFSFPASESIESVVAWKVSAGLDYRLYSLPRAQRGDKLTKKPEFPFETMETLRLEGVAPLTVQIVDAKKEPLADVRTHVWLLRKNVADEPLNLSFITEFFEDTTDKSGQVHFDWFPLWQKKTTVWPSAKGYVRARGEYDPTTANGKLEIQLDRLVPLRGRVTYPNGKPAAEIAVIASGAGYGFDHFREGAKTDESGGYEILVAPNQIYLLSVDDQKWSAPSQSGFAVLPDQNVDRHDFVLSRATRIFGRVLDLSTGEPVSGQRIYLTHYGLDLNAIGPNVLPNLTRSTRLVRPMHQWNATSSEDGGFEFFVGPGEYNLFVRNFDAQKFTIRDEEEWKSDLTVEVQSKIPFAGTVIEDETGKRVQGARVQSVSRNLRRSGDDLQATSTKDGRFQVERQPDPTYIYVTNSDGTQGAVLEIAAEETDAEFRLSKLGRAVGRLMTEDGSQPAAGVKLSYGISIKDMEGSLSTTRFGDSVTCDSDGRFSLPNLVPGWDYVCTLADHPGGYILNVAKAKVEAGQTLELGELKTPSAPKPYVPPTLEERTLQAFDVAGTPVERLENAQKTIQMVNQNLLIVFAEPTDPRVQALMKIRFEDPDFRPYSDDFRLMAIPTDKDRIAGANDLAKVLDIRAIKDKAELLLVVIDAMGEVVAKIDTTQICDGEVLSKARLLSELEKHKTTPFDARALLDEALAKANRENKRVLVQETATWCGPCHMLSRLLLANRQWEKDYVWVKMDHRWTGAIEIMKELRDGAEGGIPWFVILDHTGKKLATSNLNESGENIGFPSEPEAQKHFADMLKSTCQNMTEQEIEDLTHAATEQK